MLCACTDKLDCIESPKLASRAIVDDESISLINPTLMYDWENVDTIVLSNPLNGGIPKRVTTPWVNGTTSTLSTDFRYDILKENGWRMLFHTFKEQGTDPGQNYMCFYNQLTGFIKIFYYYEKHLILSYC
jgi:hypothetical protein